MSATPFGTNVQVPPNELDGLRILIRVAQESRRGYVSEMLLKRVITRDALRIVRNVKESHSHVRKTRSYLSLHPRVHHRYTSKGLRASVQLQTPMIFRLARCPSAELIMKSATSAREIVKPNNGKWPSQVR